MADLDELKQLGVPDRNVEDLKEQDRKMSNAWQGRPQTDKQRMKIHNDKVERRAAKMFALQPFSKMTDEQCLEKAGYTTAQLAKSKRLVKSLSNSEAYVKELARYGIGPRMIASLIADGIDLKVPLRTKYNEIVVDDDGQPVLVADHTVRLAYIDRFIRMAGAEHESVKQDGPQVSGVFIALMQSLDKMTPEERARAASGDFGVFEDALSAEHGAEAEVVDD